MKQDGIAAYALGPVCALGMAMGAADTAAGATPTYRMTTPVAPGVATPDRLETSIGELRLTDGVPTSDTVDAIYDNLGRSRALQAYLLGIPIVDAVTIRRHGPDNQTILN